MPHLLDQLREMTVVVADTGDLDAIATYRPQDATTNPSLILAAARMDAYRGIVEETIAASQRALSGAPVDDVVADAIDALAIAFGRRILDLIPGRVSTEVDARLSFDTDATVAKARHLIGRYGDEGIEPERILIKIASTWEGIRAAEVLEREGIHCNLTLLFGMHQAVACAEAGVTLISPFVGRILDWYRNSTGRESYPPHEDPGVVSVTRIYEYFKRHGHRTEVMGASFRNVGEIIELAGCDLLTIGPKFLAELESMDGTLERRLDPDAAAAMDIPAIVVDRERFDAMHADDPMATQKLAEGIESFANAARDLEALVREQLTAGS